MPPVIKNERWAFKHYAWITSHMARRLTDLVESGYKTNLEVSSDIELIGEGGNAGYSVQSELHRDFFRLMTIRPQHRRSAPLPSKSIGRIAPGILKGVFKKHGFAQGQILAQWPSIAGDELARFTCPEKIRWPRRGQSMQSGNESRETTLVLRVEGPIAVEVQHSAPQLIERINSFFGYHAIDKIRIVQGPLPRRPVPQKTVSRPLSKPEISRLKSHIGHVGDAGLRKALMRLGRGVISST